MCELEDEAMRDAQAAAHLAKVMRSIDDFFGASLQRSRDIADKIHRTKKLCDEVDEDPFTTEAEK